MNRSRVLLIVLAWLVTIVLVSCSFLFNGWRIGIIVLILHDISDIFLYWAKFFKG